MRRVSTDQAQQLERLSSKSVALQIRRTPPTPQAIASPERRIETAYRKLGCTTIMLAAFLASLFVSLSAMATETRTLLEPGRIVGGQPVGLFCKYVVTAFGSNRVDTRTWFFLPGNRVSRVYPYVGSFDPSRCSADTCGSYQIGSGQLSVRMDSGRVYQWTFAASAEGIRLDGDLYRPARPMTAKSLAGQWSGEGGATGANIYTFDGNGRFSFGTRHSALAGTYQVQGLTLTLKFADGDVQRHTLFALSAGTPVGLISVDSDVYARK